jgi:alkanesulfonate monooxygenase SsuD/methylene tetrahydromethanopterin reductase-like flavin-dependent oxidoreductase (luciferase family)
LSQAKISPVPTEHVDIWVGSLVDKAIERTARMAEGWLAAPSLSPVDSGKVLDRYMEHCAKYDRVPTATAIRRDIYVGSSSEDAKKVATPYVEKGYRGIPNDALMIGSVSEVAGQIKLLEEQGFTDIIVRNISSNQQECMACIERLSEVKEQLA